MILPSPERFVEFSCVERIPYHADYRLNSFFPRTERDWNTLPPETVSAPSIGVFISRMAKLQQTTIPYPVLGPSLFLLHINDLSVGLTSACRFFADDTICHKDVTDPHDQQDPQQDLDDLADWEQRWKMSIRPQTCSAMNITRCRTVPPSQYQLHGYTLSTETEAKYLGKITSVLRWDAHITDVCNKANKTLGFLRRNIKTTNERLKNAAFKAFVRPVLEYASPVWGPFTCNKIKAPEKG